MSGAAKSSRPEVTNLPYFWDTLSRHRHRLLALDYDGTLAPFRINRMQAYPYPGISGILARISRHRETTLAVVSGRPLAELAILLGSFDGVVIGSHGMETRFSNGNVVARVPDRDQREGLIRAQAAAEERGLQALIEVKPASVALHTRGLEASQASRIEGEIADTWSSISGQHRLEVRRFNGGLEVRSTGWNKGNALAELIRGMPEKSLCVYIGDDDTDEDAFLAIQGAGFGIRVGDPAVPTAARGFLHDIPSVRAFLQTWSAIPPVDKENVSWTRDG
ncbi:MAG: trehalose-phosphatase [Bacteriovoracaceae bacterium]|nr:trehalose-phosphatase [Bacteriovoracaceae bacterium]